MDNGDKEFKIIDAHAHFINQAIIKDRSKDEEHIRNFQNPTIEEGKKISKNEKFFSYISYTIVVILGVIVYTVGYIFVPLNEFNYDEFVTGFKQFSMFFSNDLFLIIAILPLTIGLFFISRRGNRYADSLQIMIVGILLVAPILLSFTTYNYHDYRMIPLVIAFAIGIGTLFSNVHSAHIKKSDKHISKIVFVITISIVGINILSVLFPDLIQGKYYLDLSS